MHIARILSRTCLLLPLALASAGRAAPPAASTQVATQASVPVAQDGCLDHTVRELGMSAKRAEGAARHWDIAPKFLHGALAKEAAATLTVDLDKQEKATQVMVRASWPGAPKEAEVQREIEERLRLMASKMAQTCGVIRPEVACTTTPAGAAAAPCAPASKAP